MAKIVCLDKNYSTTRLLIQDKSSLERSSEDKFETTLLLPKNEERKDEGGLRTKGYFKKSYEDKPLISIITVVFNGEKELEQTMKSVINQTYDNVEYIIIDGGSNDGTVDIIKKYEDKIDYWVSEKDNGIYDAMNKGITLASGEWINFMNAGDRFINIEVLENIYFQKISNDTKCVYGDVLINYGNFDIIKQAGYLKNLHRSMQFSHQSLFVNVEYHKNNKFDTNFKSAADYKFVYNAFMDGKIFYYTKSIVAKISNGGVSDVKRIQSILESRKIVLEKSNTFNNRLYFFGLYFKILLIDVIKKILPIKLIQVLQGKK